MFWSLSGFFVSWGGEKVLVLVHTGAASFLCELSFQLCLLVLHESKPNGTEFPKPTPLQVADQDILSSSFHPTDEYHTPQYLAPHIK